MATLLEVRDLQTHFFTQAGVVKAVDGVSYDLTAGETLGLVGESGCGKSVSACSLMRLIPDPPGKTVGGEVIFDGQDLLKLPDYQMRRVRGKQIAMVFQEPMTALNPALPIARQLTEPLELHLFRANYPGNSAVGSAFPVFLVPAVIATQALLISPISELFPRLRWGIIEANAQWIPYVLNDVKERYRAGGRRCRSASCPPRTSIWRAKTATTCRTSSAGQAMIVC